MSISVHVFDAYSELDLDLRSKLRVEIEGALQRIARFLPLSRLDVIAFAAPRLVLPEYGIGAYTMGRGLLQVTIDPASKELASTERPRRLQAIMGHELHHIIRMRGPGYGTTLGEALVSVGLATAFEEEMGLPTPVYATRVNGTKLSSLAERALKSLDDPNYDHQAWFFGRAGDAAIPRHEGYSLAYRVVKGWLTLSREQPSGAVARKAEDVLEPWRQGKLTI